MSSTIYNKSVFKRFFEKTNLLVIAWADNVYSKIESQEILPKWISREGNAFHSFWYPVCLIFAYIVIYTREFLNITSNSLLFNQWAKQWGIITDTITTQAQRETFLENYREEFRKRGSAAVFQSGIPYNGEFLRLIDYKETDDFVVGYLSAQDTGWCIGTSSPCWRSTQTLQDVNKGWENSYQVEDILNYPGIGIINKDIQDFGIGDINVIELVGDDSYLQKTFVIDPTKDYILHFNFFMILSGNWSVYISPGIKTPTQSSQNYFSYVPQDVDDNILHSFTMRINHYGSVEGYSWNNLSRTTYDISIGSIQSQDADTCQIWNVKFGPAELPLSQGYLGRRGYIVAYIKNNSQRSLEEIKDFSQKYLISFSNILLIKE